MMRRKWHLCELRVSFCLAERGDQVQGVEGGVGVPKAGGHGVHQDALLVNDDHPLLADSLFMVVHVKLGIVRSHWSRKDLGCKESCWI